MSTKVEKTPKSIRTGLQFDDLFNDADGDPWNYQNSYVIQRLDDSLKFVQQHFQQLNGRSIIEFGPFDGSFTTRLLSNFPNIKVVAVEISGVAAKKLTKELGDKFGKRLQIIHDDMASFTLDKYCDDGNPIILALECLYYLGHEERWDVLQKWKQQAPLSKIVISGPITGGSYLGEAQLEQFMQGLGYLTSAK